MLNLSVDDKTQLTRFFNDLFHTYGQYSSYSLGWSTKESQLIRFRILSEIGRLEGSEILDLGCGLGDFYGFLDFFLDKFEYKGIDITTDFIEAAKDKYPNGDFSTKDIFNIKDDSFDYVFASGVFSYNIPNYFEKYFSIIEKMFKVSRKGIAFNMLDKKNHVIDDTFMAYHPDEILQVCKGISSNCELKTDYLPQDFTIYMYK